MAVKKTAGIKHKETAAQRANNNQALVEEARAVLREYGLADAILAIDEAGWLKVNGSYSGLDVTNAERIACVQRARLYYNHDPLAKQAIRLWTGYALGKGMSWKASDDNAQAILAEFWNDPVNKSMFSNCGQRKSSDRLLVDGEIFFPIFAGGGEVHIRRIDPLEIVEIISDPDDADTPCLYKRQWITPQGKTETAYYKDWKSGSDKVYLDASNKPVKATTEAVIYHVIFNSLGKRGVSLLATSMDWSKAHRKFMEARISIVQALARFAWKVKTQGGATSVAALQTQLGTALSSTSSVDTNPPAAPGSTWVENQGVSLDSIKTETGSGSAQTDGAMLLQMLGVGMGIFPHYFGAGESFRLATATAMEMPMLVQFEAYQQQWGDVYNEIFQFVLTDNDVVKDKQFVDIDFPPIVRSDVVATITAITQAIITVPSLDVDEMRKLILTTLGLNNPDEILGKIKPREAASAQLVKAINRFTKIVKEGGRQ